MSVLYECNDGLERFRSRSLLAVSEEVWLSFNDKEFNEESSIPTACAVVVEVSGAALETAPPACIEIQLEGGERRRLRESTKDLRQAKVINSGIQSYATVKHT